MERVRGGILFSPPVNLLWLFTDGCWDFELFPFLSIFEVLSAAVQLCVNPVLHFELLECHKVPDSLSLFLAISMTSLFDATYNVKAIAIVLLEESGIV